MSIAEAADELEDAEIVCDGKECWLGTDKIAKKTVYALLRFAAISLEEMSHKVERYTLNGTGRNLLLYPEKADQVMALTLMSKSFTWNGADLVVDNGRVTDSRAQIHNPQNLSA